MIYENSKEARLEFSYLHGLFCCSISFHFNYEINYSAVSHKLEFQNLVPEIQTCDVPELDMRQSPTHLGGRWEGKQPLLNPSLVMLLLQD